MLMDPNSQTLVGIMTDQETKDITNRSVQLDNQKKQQAMQQQQQVMQALQQQHAAQQAKQTLAPVEHIAKLNGMAYSQEQQIQAMGRKQEAQDLQATAKIYRMYGLESEATKYETDSKRILDEVNSAAKEARTEDQQDRERTSGFASTITNQDSLEQAIPDLESTRQGQSLVAKLKKDYGDGKGGILLSTPALAFIKDFHLRNMSDKERSASADRQESVKQRIQVHEDNMKRSEDSLAERKLQHTFLRERLTRKDDESKGGLKGSENVSDIKREFPTTAGEIIHADPNDEKEQQLFQNLNGPMITKTTGPERQRALGATRALSESQVFADNLGILTEKGAKLYSVGPFANLKGEGLFSAASAAIGRELTKDQSMQLQTVMEPAYRFVGQLTQSGVQLPKGVTDSLRSALEIKSGMPLNIAQQKIGEAQQTILAAVEALSTDTALNQNQREMFAKAYQHIKKALPFNQTQVLRWQKDMERGYKGDLMSHIRDAPKN